MSAHYADATVALHHGDCLDVLRELPDASVDAVVTDPPYGLEFMGKDWDAPWKPSSVGHGVRVETERADEMTERGKRHSTAGGPYLAARVDSVRVAGLPFQQWCEQWATECLRVLKPGGHLLAFGGTRTWHRLACAVEDAGFEVRDSIAWLYGSGFPKSLDVSKAIDKAAGAEREVVGKRNRDLNWRGVEDPDSDRYAGTRANLPAGSEQGHVSERPRMVPLTAPATDDARTWQGWGTALKPAFEPIVVARKPLAAGTVAGNVLAWGTGALNVDGCRIDSGSDYHDLKVTQGGKDGGGFDVGSSDGTRHTQFMPAAGRWPANVVLDEHHEPVLRLRYNLPVEVERTIRESFGASTDHLPAMPGADAGATEPRGADPVLLPRLLREVDGSEPDGREGPAMAALSYPRVTTEDGGLAASEGPHWAEGVDLEGRHLQDARLCDGEDVGALAGGPSASRADGHSEPGARGLSARASTSGRTEAGSSATADRARSSHERGQGRQPAGEPGGSLSGGAQADPREGRGRVAAPATRERRAAVAPLEVLRRECPPGWWDYFEVVGHRREGQAAELDQQSGELHSQDPRTRRPGNRAGGETFGLNENENAPGYHDTGGASRFFYVAKADAPERVRIDGIAHPTVKPLALMRWLVRLVTPPGGTVLEPFAGSGTTVEACILEGFRCIAIEREADYLPLILQRIHRRRDPVAAVRGSGEDGGLFDLLDGEGA